MQTHIKSITDGKSGEIYSTLLESINYTKPNIFIQEAYHQYTKLYTSNPSINGRIFEYLICETLAQEHITPFYYQAKFHRVPNADFDIVLYQEHSPTVLTLKTSLRERYKQADLEALALKQVYRKSTVVLVTLSKSEYQMINKKILNDEIVGLSGCILATDDQYQKFIVSLKEQCFTTANKILPVVGKRVLR